MTSAPARSTRLRRTLAATLLVAPVLAVAGPTTAATATDVIDADAADGAVGVTNGTTQLVLQTDPVAIAVLGPDGEVLASVVNELPPPTPYGDYDRPPGGNQPPRASSVYAPLTFTLGGQALLQFPASFWSADLLTAAAVGTQHNVERISDVRVEGDSLVATASTNDPSGRTATITVSPQGTDGVRLELDLSSTEGVVMATASFASPAEEAFRGFGGRRNRLDQRGQDFVNWLEEFHQQPDDLEGGTALPTSDEAYQFPSGAQGAYYVQSQFVSSQPYALLVDRDEITRWRMASDRDDAWQVSAGGAELDLVVTAGSSPQEAARSMTAITGRHALAPRWAMEPGVSRAVQELGGGNAEQYAAQVLADLDEIERLDLPLEHYAIEGFPWLEDVDALEQVLARMAELDLRPLGYLKAFTGGTESTERAGVHDEALAEGYVATTAAGTPFLFGSPVDAQDPAGLIDFTNDAADAWWTGRVHELLDLGFDGFMQDFGEQTFVDMRFADGSEGFAMHNRYPRLFHDATRRAFDSWMAANPDRDEPWFYVRSGYSGAPGSAAVEHTSWGGDNTADWSRGSGIASVVPDMLNRGLGGAVGYATDIGGFIDSFGPVDAELLTRWSQLSVFFPIHRVHGSPVNGTPMPWQFDDAMVERYRDTIELHSDAVPLLVELWEESLATGTPIARPMWWHHADAPADIDIEQQWLVGPDVLVAPVVEPGATSRDVWFPDGCWEHGTLGTQVEGPATTTVNAPLDVLPWYVPCGTDPLGAAAGRASNPVVGDDPALDGATNDDAELAATGGGAALLAFIGLVAAVSLRRRDQPS